MKMKELESRTGVNREAIRYYIREGLLPQPQKPKRNVAEYQTEHVERTLLIKRLQDEHFLPLKVVKKVIDEVARTATAGTLSQPALAELLPALIKDTADNQSRSVEDLIASTGMSREDIAVMAEIAAITIGEDDQVSARDAEIVRIWAAAQTMGFTVERGYDTAFLRNYVSLAQQWADLEAEHFLKAFQDVSEDVTSEDAAAALGVRGIDISNRLVSLMHTNALLTKIGELTTDAS
jgi:DNA-binding transcriptional MerR regulator